MPFYITGICLLPVLLGVLRACAVAGELIFHQDLEGETRKTRAREMTHVRQVLAVDSQQPKGCALQPQHSNFQGFKFQLPWAAHLFNITANASDDLQVSNGTSISGTRNIPNACPLGHSVGKPAVSKFPALSMPSKYINLTQRQTKASQKQSVRSPRLKLTEFKSLSGIPMNYTRSEMVQSVEGYEFIETLVENLGRPVDRPRRNPNI